LVAVHLLCPVNPAHAQYHQLPRSSAKGTIQFYSGKKSSNNADTIPPQVSHTGLPLVPIVFRSLPRSAKPATQAFVPHRLARHNEPQPASEKPWFDTIMAANFKQRKGFYIAYSKHERLGALSQINGMFYRGTWVILFSGHW